MIGKRSYLNVTLRTVHEMSRFVLRAIQKKHTFHHCNRTESYRCRNLAGSTEHNSSHVKGQKVRSVVQSYNDHATIEDVFLKKCFLRNSCYISECNNLVFCL